MVPNLLRCFLTLYLLICLVIQHLFRLKSIPPPTLLHLLTGMLPPHPCLPYRAPRRTTWKGNQKTPRLVQFYSLRVSCETSSKFPIHQLNWATGKRFGDFISILSIMGCVVCPKNILTGHQFAKPIWSSFSKRQMVGPYIQIFGNKSRIVASSAFDTIFARPRLHLLGWNWELVVWNWSLSNREIVWTWSWGSQHIKENTYSKSANWELVIA